ncbi:hypothetical protein [Maritalea myrionectae]|nr:hypothetical protein [Maritalea myrionectae]
MIRLALTTLLVLATIFVVPIVVYGLFSSVSGLEPPGESPLLFLLGVFVSKAGTALAFVWIYYVARESFEGRWPLYAAIWMTMFGFGEVGQAIGPDYSWQEAVAGMISEMIYFSASAYIVNKLIGAKTATMTKT